MGQLDSIKNGHLCDCQRTVVQAGAVKMTTKGTDLHPLTWVAYPNKTVFRCIINKRLGYVASLIQSRIQPIHGHDKNTGVENFCSQGYKN